MTRRRGAIRESGAEIVSYGAPVLPGAMFCLAYFPDGDAGHGTAWLCDVRGNYYFRPAAAPGCRRRADHPGRHYAAGKRRPVSWL